MDTAVVKQDVVYFGRVDEFSKNAMIASLSSVLAEMLGWDVAIQVLDAPLHPDESLFEVGEATSKRNDFLSPRACRKSKRSFLDGGQLVMLLPEALIFWLIWFVDYV